MRKPRLLAYGLPALLMTAFSAGYWLAPGTALASDSSTNISVSPLTFDLSANPGDTITNEILVRNSGSGPVVITPEVEDFVADGDEGQISLKESGSTYSLASWIQVDGGQVTLGGGQQQYVKFVIRVPFNAEPGGHYASVFAHLSPTTSNASNGSGVGEKIGALILLRVGGNAKEAADFSQFTTSKPRYDKGPVDFDILIENTGSVHVKPLGVIAVTDMFGKKVASIAVDQRIVLPGAKRRLSAAWANPPAFGKFNATILALYGSSNQQITATTSFWIIPWKPIILWGGVILAILVGLWLVRRRMSNAFKAFLDKK